MTTTIDDTTEQTRQVIIRDRFDVAAWDTVLDTMPRVVDDSVRLSEIAWTAERGYADVFQTLVKGAPTAQDEWRLDPSFQPNHRVVTTLMGLDVWAQLRQHTVGDPFVAGLALAAMTDELAALYRRLADTQAKADAAAAARAELDEAADTADTDPGSAQPGDDDGLGDLAAAVEAADAAADADLNAMGPAITTALEAAATEAVEAVEGEAGRAATWGIERGELSTMDPARRLALSDRLDNERTERVMAVMGRFHQQLDAIEATTWDVGVGEFSRLVHGNDLNRVLPSELVNLAVPELVPEFMLRYETKSLLQREYRFHPKEARGGIVYVEDSSGTMAGQRTDWARAFGLALLRIAARQNRAFQAIVFAGPGDYTTFDFGADASTASIDDQLAYAEFTMDGGTDFAGPLDEALTFIEAEHAATGRTRADVVFATDGIASLTDDWVTDWNARRADIGCRCYGIVIGLSESPNVDRVSDQVTNVQRLVDGADITDIFRNVSAPKEHL